MAPAVTLLGRRLRGRLDALRPDRSAAVREAQSRQVEAAGGRIRQLQVGQAVLTRAYTQKGNRWTEGQISATTGPVSYKVDMGNGSVWRRHQDQIIPLSHRNRFSLSRASMSPAEPNPHNNDGADGGSAAETTGAPTAAAVAAPAAQFTEEDWGESSADVPGVDVDLDYGDALEDEQALEVGPPAASARELRAFRRNKNKA